MQDPAVPTVFSGYKRVWIVDWPEASTDASALSMAAPLLHRFHFRAASVRVFATSMPLGVVLAVPAATHS
jgi:hypothetical protein